MGEAGLVAILFTDLVGSTELATRQGDAAADALRRDHFSPLREALASTGGTEIKTIGDALMASFAGASGRARRRGGDAAGRRAPQPAP